MTRSLIPRKCPRYLTRNPFGGRICCDVDPDQVSDKVFGTHRDLYFGMMFNQVHGGLGFGFLQHSNIDPTVGLRFRF